MGFMCPKQQNRGQKRALRAFKVLMSRIWRCSGRCWASFGSYLPKKVAAAVYEKGLLVWAAAAARRHSAMPGSLSRTPKGFDDDRRTSRLLWARGRGSVISVRYPYGICTISSRTSPVHPPYVRTISVRYPRDARTYKGLC